MSGRTDSRGKWPVARDYYSILGVTPTSEDVVIRAAYRALMRRYHPDADPSGEAAERAQAINAAYAVLSDPEKRARYDGSLAAQGLIKAEPSSKRRRSRSRRFVPGPAAFVGHLHRPTDRRPSDRYRRSCRHPAPAHRSRRRRTG